MNHQFTDEDLQNYVDGTFRGNIAALENYLQQNPSAQKQVDDYRLMIKTVSELEVPDLTFDLANAVLHRVKKQKNSWLDNLIPASLVIIAGILMLLPFNLFNNIDNPVFFVILCIALCAALAIFHAPEILKRRKIFHETE